MELTADEQELLTGRERPIVIARRRAGAAVADAVAPGSPDLGVMLPYTPLHHLLLAEVGGPLVMTSANVSDEPIAYRDDDAPRAPGRDRGPVREPRPPDPHPHRRLGGALHGARAADGAPLARVRAGQPGAARGGAGADHRRTAPS